jgi:hypothetical protein
MSADDLRHVFQVESHDLVPEYDLTDVRLIHKRSVDPRAHTNDPNAKQIHIKAFGKKFRLNLQKNNEFNDRIQDMKVFMAETTGNGKLRYSEAPTGPDNSPAAVGTTYHDKSNMAAILVDHNSDGSLQLHGTIGNDLVIRPVPQTVSADNEEYLRYNADDEDDEMFLDEDEAIENKRINHSNNSPNVTQNKSLNSTGRTPSQPLPISTASSYTKNSYNNTTNLGNTHFVYKRNLFDPQNTYHSDYCEFFFLESQK